MGNLFMYFLAFLFIVWGFLVIGGIGALVTMWAWNIALVPLFGIQSINFLQAFGVNILIGLFTRVTRVRS